MSKRVISIYVEDILKDISDEKDVHADYLRLCAHYGIDPHPVAEAISLAKIETLEALLSKRQLR